MNHLPLPPVKSLKESILEEYYSKENSKDTSKNHYSIMNYLRAYEVNFAEPQKPTDDASKPNSVQDSDVREDLESSKSEPNRGPSL